MQNHPNIEYIVIDGGSTDGSHEIIKANSSTISFWCSEPDKGIGDAFNKGLSHVTGDYVLFLNSDDQFCTSDSLSILANEASSKTAMPDVVCGAIVYSDLSRGLKYVEKPHTQNLWNFMTVFHPSMMAKRALFTELGPYDTGYLYSMDSELCHRWLAADKLFHCFETPISVMQLGGVSDKFKVRSQAEFLKSSITHSGKILLPTLYFFRQLIIHAIFQIKWVKKIRVIQRGISYESNQGKN